jgi:hypothetical protein
VLGAAATGAIAGAADTVFPDGDIAVPPPNLMFGSGGNQRECTTLGASAGYAGAIKISYNGGGGDDNHFNAGEALSITMTPNAAAQAAGITAATDNTINTVPTDWNDNDDSVSIPFHTFVPASVGDSTAVDQYDIEVTVAGADYSAGAGSGGGKPHYNVSVNCSATAPADNGAPTVKTAAPDALGTEGDILSTSGAFSDPDSTDTLTLTASPNVGTFVDNGDGTWNWSLATNDDVALAAITVSADDGHGHTTSDAFNYRALNGNPVLSSLAITGTNCTPTLGFSWTDPGSADTFTGAINWGDASTSTSFTTSPVSASHAYASAGNYTIGVNVADDDGGTDSDSIATYSVYNIPSQMLQPINYTGPRSAFKLGSTIPVKITVKDCSNNSVSSLTPTVSVMKLDNAPDGTDMETVSTANPTSGTTMRYDATGAQYIYNLATKQLSSGDFKISITDPTFATPVTAIVSIKK